MTVTIDTSLAGGRVIDAVRHAAEEQARLHAGWGLAHICFAGIYAAACQHQWQSGAGTAECDRQLFLNLQTIGSPLADSVQIELGVEGLVAVADWVCAEWPLIIRRARRRSGLVGAR